MTLPRNTNFVTTTTAIALVLVLVVNARPSLAFFLPSPQRQHHNSHFHVTTQSRDRDVNVWRLASSTTTSSYDEGEYNYDDWYDLPVMDEDAINNPDAQWYSPPAPPTPVHTQDDEVKLEEAVVKLSSHVQAAIHSIESAQDFEKFLYHDDRVSVVKLHAAWCKACRQFGLRFHKLAVQKADWIDNESGKVVHPGQIRLASLEVSQNPELVAQLGVEGLPAVAFFYKGRKLAGYPCPPGEFTNKVTRAVEHYLQLSPAELKFEADMEQGKNLIPLTFDGIPKARVIRHRRRKNRPSKNHSM